MCWLGRQRGRAPAFRQDAPRAVCTTAPEEELALGCHGSRQRRADERWVLLTQSAKKVHTLPSPGHNLQHPQVVDTSYCACNGISPAGLQLGLALELCPRGSWDIDCLGCGFEGPRKRRGRQRLKEGSGQKGVSFPLSLIFKGAGAKSSVTSECVRVQGGLRKQKSLVPPTLHQRQPTRTPIP